MYTPREEDSLGGGHSALASRNCSPPGGGCTTWMLQYLHFIQPHHIK